MEKDIYRTISASEVISNLRKKRDTDTISEEKLRKMTEARKKRRRKNKTTYKNG